jgi:hypothetical protein
MRFFSLFFVLLSFLLDPLCADEWKRVYLASFPRSGNHWVRFLIEEATNIATSSAYCDNDLTYPHLPTPFPWGGYCCDHGYEGNRRYPDIDDIVVIKTHFPSFLKTIFDCAPSLRVIRIVRHPIDCIYSNYAYERPCANIIPTSFIHKCIRAHNRFQKHYNIQTNVITFRYEDLHADPFTVFKQILESIGYFVKDEDIIRAIERYPPKDHILKHLNRYTPHDIKYIQKELGSFMKQFGYTIP